MNRHGCGGGSWQSRPPLRVVHGENGSDPTANQLPVQPLSQSRADVIRAALGDARVGVERRSLKMIVIAGQRAAQALGMAK